MKTIELKDAKGKSLPKSYANTLAKLVAFRKILPDYPDLTTTRTNPYSGVTVTLPYVAAGIADWIVSSNPYPSSPTKGGLKRSDWDNARYLFCLTWPEQYYDLID